MKPEIWQNVNNFGSRSYRCGFCGDQASGFIGYLTNLNAGADADKPHIFICTTCGQPTYFDGIGNQVPGVIEGVGVGSVPKSVNAVYEEARRSFSVSAYAGVTLLLRKLIMHVAHEKMVKDPNEGASKKRTSFEQYVNYLRDSGKISTEQFPWVDQIRKSGNEANHEINVVTQEQAKDLLDFAEMLLKNLYEYPAKVKSLESEGDALTEDESE